MNDTILNNCPSCEAICSVTIDHVGTNVICPNCTQEFLAYQPNVQSQSPKAYPKHLFQTPAIRLYTLESINIATFFGSFFAAGIIMASNYRRQDNNKAANQTLIYSFIGQIALFLILILINGLIPASSKIPDSLFLFPQYLIMRKIAKYLQGPTIEAHIESGGTVESNWKAAGISVVVFLFWWAFFKIVFGVSII